MRKIWRILSIDGGGVRGIIPATLLAFIEERTGKPIAELFDLIAGTSTGGILALGLTKPNASGRPQYTALDLCNVYEEQVSSIFRNPQSWWGNLLSPKYRSTDFRHILRGSFTSYMLKEALTDVVIPCYDIEHRLPYMFKSRWARHCDEFDFPMRDVALAASASPTLFHPVPIARVGRRRAISLVDGGVFANNPAIIALSEMKSMGCDETDRYYLVSVGTGKTMRPLTEELISLWGYVHWSRPMLELVMESISESVHEQVRHLISSTSDQSYHRLQVDLPESINMAIDDASRKNVKSLRKIAEAYCSSELENMELNNICDQLLRLSERATCDKRKT